MGKFLFFLIASSIRLIAAPQGLMVDAGVAMIESTSSSSFSISASDRAVLNWDSFSIAADESVRFIQPSSDAIAINRILGSTPSEILGSLSANGKILLINPHGVIFGHDARIDVQSMIASSLDLQMDFLPKLHFKGDSLASICNAGSLVAKEIFLIGHHVENSGFLEGNQIALLAGHNVYLGEEISMQYAKSSDPSHAIVSGTIRACGGSISLFGEHVEILEGARLDASGSFGGGTILVGGKNSAVENAKWTYLAKGAFIHADALENGPGGKVVLWSDWATAHYGEISANGGPLGGDGGFIEVSARGPLEYHGLSFTTSAMGKRGTLLLDPTDVTISTAVTAGVVFGGCPGGLYTAAGLAADLNNIDLATQLAFGTCDVIVSTASAAGSLGSITVLDPVEWNSPNGLTFQADFNVFIHTRVANGTLGMGVGPATGHVIVRSNAAFASGASVIIQPTQFPMMIASIGSKDGLTLIDVPLLPIFVLGGTAPMMTSGQIGFNLGSFAGPGVATGPIVVNCDNLLLRGGSNTFAGAQIGHGSIGTPFGSFGSDLDTIAAPITVTVAGNVFLESGTVSSTPVMIGHGSAFPTDIVFMHAQRGDITVTSLFTDIFMRDQVPGLFNNSITIGHGYSETTGPIPFIAELSGNISVNTPRKDVRMTANFPGLNNDILIGHHVLGFGNLPLVTGNIDVFAAGLLFMFTGPGAQAAMIGHQCHNVFTTVVGTYRVGTGCNLRMIGNGDFTVIGLQNSTFTTFIGDVEVASGFDIFMTTSTMDTTLSVFTMIGVRTTPSGIIGPSPSNTFVSAGRNITITPSNTALFGCQLGIDASRNVYVSAGGNIEIFGGASGLTLISAEDSATSTTRIYAGGHILATNGPVANASFGNGLADYSFSLDIRAAGDLQMATSYPLFPHLPTAGAIYLEADANFAAGDLFTVGGGTITSIALAPLSSSIPNGTFRCAGMSATSPFIPANGFGGFRVVSSPLDPLDHIILTTTSGNITIHSASTQEDTLTPQDLRIGPANGINNLNIVTTDGNIEVWGSVPGDAFRDIYVDGPVTTTGSILMVANRDMELTPNANVSSFANFTTLVVDNFFPVRPFIGTGAFRMAAGSQANAATTLRVYTARQPFNLIQGLLNGFSFTAGPIFVDTLLEQWCTYFPEPFKGVPFTIFYKDCLQLIASQATLIIDEFLIDLHPADENPGWAMRYLIEYREKISLPTEPYWLRHRQLKIINHPKSWTVLSY